MTTTPSPPSPPPPAKKKKSKIGVKPAITHGEDLIDMTAMVDIVFFLLIFFMVTSITALQSVIGLPNPESSSANSKPSSSSAADPGFVQVIIDDVDAVWLEGEQVTDLRVRLRSIRQDNPEIDGMIVVGNPDASHGTLVMVLDAGAEVGMSRLRFTVKEHPDY